MKVKLPIVFTLLLVIILICTCDRRSGGVMGPYQPYNLDFVPSDSQTVADEEIRMYCFVTDGFDNLVPGVRLVFETLDFGFIASEKYSSEDTVDGLAGTLYFDPQGEYGVCYLAARIASEDSIVEYSNSDTTIVMVHPYILELDAEYDTISVSESTQLYCLVINPITMEQTGDIHIRFYALDFGSVPSVMINSSATDPTGLQSLVFYTAPPDTAGEARIAANAVWGTQDKIIGADNICVWVVED